LNLNASVCYCCPCQGLTVWNEDAIDLTEDTLTIQAVFRSESGGAIRSCIFWRGHTAGIHIHALHEVFVLIGVIKAVVERR
jgi:hypothetical protein